MRLLAALVALLLCRTLAAAPPTDNPLASAESTGEGYPAWTDAIRWDRVIDMGTYAKGKNDFQKFENARDELTAKGGGVLYYPAGTYDFSDMPADGPNGRGLMLKSGVVIRGEAPVEKADASAGKLDLPTRFNFGFRKMGTDKERKAAGSVPHQWGIVGITPGNAETLKDVHDVGICWVHLVGATVYFGPELKWGDTWATAGGVKSKFVKDAWKKRKPDGTHPLDPVLGAPPGDSYVGAGRGRLVYGCTLQDAAVPQDYFQEGNGAETFHTFRDGARVAVYGSRVFVARNVLPESRKNFTYLQTTRKTSAGKNGEPVLGEFVPETTILFDYGNTDGIDVNKSQAAPFGGGLFEEGIVVRDNFVFNHGHRGFNVSGKWLTVRRNVNERIFLKGGADVYGLGEGWTLTIDGNLHANSEADNDLADNASRGFDIAGKQVWVDSNKVNNTGSSPGNDGDAILVQLPGGANLVGFAITRNAHDQGKGYKGFMGAWDTDVRGLLMAWNETPGWCGFTLVGKRDVADAAIVNNTAARGIRTGKITGDAVIVECPDNTPKPPTNVKAEPWQKDAVKVTWEDASDNEIGFRVDRSLDDGKTWTTVAYRPPHMKIEDPDALAWVDFTLPAGKITRYRVVALDCDEKVTGASAASEPVQLKVKE